MRVMVSFIFMMLLSISLFGTTKPQIRGAYLETRSADVYVGQCFANGEMNTAGQEAIVAWHISQGQWDGVSLDGLTIVGAIKAQATLGDPFDPDVVEAFVLLLEEGEEELRKAG